MKNCIRLEGGSVLIFVVFFCSIFTAEAKIIYQDDFSGGESESINGLPPDIAPGSETWTSFKNRWHANGQKYSTSYDTISLPFVPESGKVYELSATLDATNTWIGVAFDPAMSKGCTPWIRVANDYTLDTAVSGYMGEWTRGLAVSFGPSDPGYVDVAIRLDTQPENWLVTFYYNGEQLGEPTEYTTNPEISTVGLLAYTKDGPDADFFQLEDITSAQGSIFIVY